MIRQKCFEFNPFAENTYIIYQPSGDAVIIDPGCSNDHERAEIKEFIYSNKLKPVLLLNTHAHIDHVLGNAFVQREYGLKPLLHKNEYQILQALMLTASFYGVEAEPSPEPERFIEENEIITLTPAFTPQPPKGGVGTFALKVIYCPGHSPGGVCFYAEKEKILWGGDVLFYESIGRTDLPGGDYDTLIENIKTKILTLPDDVQVFSGHGPETTIGHEKRHNPFLS